MQQSSHNKFELYSYSSPTIISEWQIVQNLLVLLKLPEFAEFMVNPHTINCGYLIIAFFDRPTAQLRGSQAAWSSPSS